MTTPALEIRDLHAWYGASHILRGIDFTVGRGELFGLLDHDLFPTAPDDPFAPLATQDVYGYVRTTEPPSERWFLWAGFTMMRFSAVRDLPLDFGQEVGHFLVGSQFETRVG